MSVRPPPPPNKLAFTGWLRRSILRCIFWSFLFQWLSRASVNFWETILLTHLPAYYNSLSVGKNKILISLLCFNYWNVIYLIIRNNLLSLNYYPWSETLNFCLCFFCKMTFSILSTVCLHNGNPWCERAKGMAL